MVFPPFVHIFQSRRDGAQNKIGKKKTANPTSQTHISVSMSTLKPPYQGSVYVFGPTVLSLRTMKLYHRKHRLMEAHLFEIAFSVIQ